MPSIEDETLNTS